MFLVRLILALLSINAGAVASAPAVRFPAPQPPVVNNVSTCGHPYGETATIIIPAISYNCPVYRGDQSTIDTGVVTWMDTLVGETVHCNTCWAEKAGAHGVLWIGAHHVSHGAPFLAVPNLHIGDIVIIEDSWGIATYRISSSAVYTVDAYGNVIHDGVVDPYGGNRAIFGPTLEPNVSKLVLMTCLTDNTRLMMYGELVQ